LYRANCILLPVTLHCKGYNISETQLKVISGTHFPSKKKKIKWQSHFKIYFYPHIKTKAFGSHEYNTEGEIGRKRDMDRERNFYAERYIFWNFPHI
jgi:hypothetical protein